jgi:hypothetical protein
MARESYGKVGSLDPTRDVHMPIQLQLLGHSNRNDLQSAFTFFYIGVHLYDKENLGPQVLAQILGFCGDISNSFQSELFKTSVLPLDPALTTFYWLPLIAALNNGLYPVSPLHLGSMLKIWG